MGVRDVLGSIALRRWDGSCTERHDESAILAMGAISEVTRVVIITMLL